MRLLILQISIGVGNWVAYGSGLVSKAVKGGVGIKRRAEAGGGGWPFPLGVYTRSLSLNSLACIRLASLPCPTSLVREVFVVRPGLTCLPRIVSQTCLFLISLIVQVSQSVLTVQVELKQALSALEDLY